MGSSSVAQEKRVLSFLPTFLPPPEVLIRKARKEEKEGKERQQEQGDTRGGGEIISAY